MKRLRSLLLVVLAVMLALSGCGPSSCSKDDGGEDGGETEATLTLEVGESAEFEYAGETHTAELLSVTGSSAEIVISSSPTSYILTEGVPAEADLNDDSTPDSTLAVTDVGNGSATLSVAALAALAYDETDFETQGGLGPYNITNYYEQDPAMVVLDDGTYLLFYTGGDERAVQWEHYNADGTQIQAPQLGAGRVDPMAGTPRGEFMNVARMGDHIYMVSEILQGTCITSYNLDMSGGTASFITPWDEDAALATDGQHLWLATQTAATVYRAGAGSRPAVQIMQIVGGDAPALIDSATVTNPPDGSSDVAPTMAYDPATELLAVPYERFTNATNLCELRCAIVDPTTLETVLDLQVASTDEYNGGLESGVAALAYDGVVLVFWQTGGHLNQHISTVDCATGAVEQTYAADGDTGIPTLTANNWDVELVEIASGPALLYLNPNVHGEYGESDQLRHRYVLAPLTAEGPAGDQIILEGGQPIFADVTFDLASLKSNPKKAVCGSPCLLNGTVINRGSRDANKVVLEAKVSGESIGTIDLGVINPGESVTFAKVWDVPPDLTAETVDVSYSLTTTSDQYTSDNDSAETTVQVMQKGVVQGRVTNVSGAVPSGWWAGGLPGVEVTFGGKTVLTDANGCFTIEEVEFGSGTLTATKDGFNPQSTTVETTRTKPIASVGIRLDNHGTLRVHVTDETGAALSGVQCFLLGYDRTDTTDENGDLVLEIPYGTYSIAFKKSGYMGLAPREFEVLLGEETAGSVELKEATTAQLSGRIVDAKGTAVAGATVVITNSKGETVATLTTDAEGNFNAGELPVKPSGSYTITATGAGLTVSEPIGLTGGEIASMMVGLVPDAGELAMRQATEGYTSWMLKAAWPGFLDVGGQSIYVWYGNYAVRVGAEYWDGNRDLNRVDVTTWGGTYETHVTKGEIEFPVSGDDLTGNSGKKLPTAMAQTTDATSQAWWKSAAKGAWSLYKEYDPAINLAKTIYSGIKDVKAAFSGEDEWLILGQGSEVLTWKESLDDFNMRPEYDSEHPIDSLMSMKDKIPTSFAIPIVIGGSSVQDTAVRCDGIDVVDKETGEIYYSDRAQWFSYTDDDETNTSFRSFDIGRSGVSAENVRIYVWVKVQKYWLSEPGGTCFDQREQQVIIFDPDTGGQKAFIAPGDMYLDPGRWTTEDIARLTE